VILPHQDFLLEVIKIKPVRPYCFLEMKQVAVADKAPVGYSLVSALERLRLPGRTAAGFKWRPHKAAQSRTGIVD
jgi:hypothetical protein